MAVVKIDKGKMTFVRKYTQGEKMKPGELAFEIESIDQLKRHNSRIKVNSPRKIIKYRNQNVEEWDWSKISSEKLLEIKKHYSTQTWPKIMKIHNELKLTEQVYCCESYVDHIKINIEKYLPNVELSKFT